MRAPTRVASAMAGLFVAGSAAAGPPLVTDDPNVVEKGHAEAIIAGAGVQRSRNERDWVGPLLDVSVGVASSLELGLQTIPVWGSAGKDGLIIVAGTKWAPVQRDRIVVAIAPSLGVATQSGGNEFAFLPLQLEARIGRWQVGTEGGYEVIESAGDGWRIGAYAVRQVLPSLVLMAEIYRQDAEDGSDTAASVGADIEVANGWSVLVSAGAGLAADRVNRLDWAGYLGLQRTF
jgi:hypothetical protein